MEVQEGDADPSPFSFLNTTVANKVRRSMYVRMGGFIDPTEDNQVACYKTHTTPETHRLIRESMHLSVHIQETKKGRLFYFIFLAPKFIWGVGPRYCPSLEAKVARFSQERHIVWLEPEGYDSGT
jgi:tRNA uridine 5-carboxymethylaminomethyl modification enzyme